MSASIAVKVPRVALARATSPAVNPNTASLNWIVNVTFAAVVTPPWGVTTTAGAVPSQVTEAAAAALPLVASS